jgi:CRISPR-associated protein Cas2
MYIVCYDICDHRRWRDVYKVICGYGKRLQYSVFRCELLAEDKVRLIARLDKLINHDEDQILVFDLGLLNGHGAKSIEYCGIPYEHSERKPVVV